MAGTLMESPFKSTVMTANTNANANKVFNINVVTEDGKTDHEDYPHEIDLANYPQLLKDSQTLQRQKTVDN